MITVKNEIMTVKKWNYEKEKEIMEEKNEMMKAIKEMMKEKKCGTIHAMQITLGDVQTA